MRIAAAILVILAGALWALQCGGGGGEAKPEAPPAVAPELMAGSLLQNGSAAQGTLNWWGDGETGSQALAGGRRCFWVRNGGALSQDVEIPGAEGRWALLIGHLASERTGDFTGLAYLYGYLLRPEGENERILAYLQGETMLRQEVKPNEWIVAHGVFPVPKGTTKIRFFLNQANRNGVPHNGSKARFTDLGLFLFDSEQEARAFVQRYPQQ